MADSIEPMDLETWLASLGAPESIMSILPKELREIDVTSVMKMLATVNAPSFGSISVETVAVNSSSVDPDSQIQWLPVVRDKG